MTLHIHQQAHEAIISHAEEGYPNEICGIMLGNDKEDRRSIEAIMRIDNSFQTDEQHHRFLITPHDMFKAEKLARKDGLDILGVYHSHPDDEARPSEYDRAHAAWTAWSYIIVSVMSGRSEGMRAWKLRPDRSSFDEESLSLLALNASGEDE